MCACQSENCLPDLFDTSEDDSYSLGGCCGSFSFRAYTTLEIVAAKPLKVVSHQMCKVQLADGKTL